MRSMAAEEIITVFKGEITDLKSKQDELKGGYHELNKAELQSLQTTKALTKAIEEEEAHLAELIKLRSRASSPQAIQSYNKHIETSRKKINDLTKSTRDLTKSQKQVTDENKKSAKSYDELGAVGSDALGSLDTATGGVITKGKTAIKTTLALTRGMSLLKAAIASTGIGLLIVALGSLAAFFTQTQRGADLLSRASSRLSAGWDVLKDRASQLGESIYNAFADDPQQAIKDFGQGVLDFAVNRIVHLYEAVVGVGDIVVKVFEGDWKGAMESAKDVALDAWAGIDLIGGAIYDQRDAIKDVADEIEREAKKADELTQAAHRLRDAQRDLNVERAQSRALIKELNLIAEDTSKSEEERINAAQQALSIEQKLLKERERLAAENLRIITEQNALGETMAEDLDRQAEAEIELANIREESLELQTTINNKINAIKQSAHQKELQREAELRAAALEAQQLAIDAVESAAAFEQNQYDQLLGNKQISQQEYNQITLDNELTRLAQLQTLYDQESLEYQELELQKLQAQQAFADKSIALEKKRQADLKKEIKEGSEAQLLALDTRFQKGEVAEEDYNAEVLRITQERLDALAALEEEGSVQHAKILNEKAKAEREYADYQKQLSESVADAQRQEDEGRLEDFERVMGRVVDATNQVADAFIQASEQRLAEEEKRLDRQRDGHERELDRLNEQLTTATGNDRKRIEAEIENQKKIQAEEEAQFRETQKLERERISNFKKAQLAVMTIQEAVAVARAFAELGPIAGTVAAAALAVKFALLFDQIESAEFFEGTDYLRPNNPRQGRKRDDIPVMANKGEAIIQTDMNQKHHDLVKAIRRDRVGQYLEQNPQLFKPEWFNRIGATQNTLLNPDKARKISVNSKFNDRGIINGVDRASRRQEYLLSTLIRETKKQNALTLKD